MAMYNPHRGLGPAPTTAASRLNELLEGIRAEFDSQARASGEYEHSSTYLSAGNQRSTCTTQMELLTLYSCQPDSRDAIGTREGLCDGTNTLGPEAEVSGPTIFKAVELTAQGMMMKSHDFATNWTLEVVLIRGQRDQE